MESTPSRPRLLLASPYYPAHGGGVELVAGHLASGLAKEGFEIAWVASDCDTPPGDAALECIPMRSINAVERRTGLPVPLWTFGALRRARDELRRCDALVMHECLYVPNLVLAQMARSLGKPLVLVQHAGDVPFRSRWLRLAVRTANRLAGRFVQRRAARVVFISDVVREFYRAAAPSLLKDAQLVANGVALDMFRPLPADARMSKRAELGLPLDQPVLLFVGRFLEKKGIGLVERMARERPAWTWLFVGSGPVAPESWDLPQVRVVGRIPQQELSDWYAASDLLVLPSYGEGFPLVVQEAMACGLPAAIPAETARALPGVAAQVFAQEVGEDAQATCRKWLATLDRAMAGEAAARREDVARFAQEQWSWERCVREHRKIIEDALRGAGARAYE
jgi:glycosyltransferase involved in cell wall biosynthesis